MDAADPRLLVVDLCRQLHARGWAPASGGGASVRAEGRIFVAPSGISRERLVVDDVLELDLDGRLVVQTPDEHPTAGVECVPLFMNAYRLRNAGAVIRSQSPNAILAGLTVKDEWRVSHLDLQKAIRGVRYHDVHVVPVIENTANEVDLADPMADAMLAQPGAHAVLVRRQGAFYWGRDLAEARHHADCYEHLFEVSLQMRRFGLDPGHQPT